MRKRICIAVVITAVAALYVYTYGPQRRNARIITEVERGNYAVLAEVVDSRRDAPDLVSGRERVIMVLSSRGELEWIRRLRERGFSCVLADESGATPLHRAVWGGHVATARYLIDAGNDVNAVASSGTTPLLGSIFQSDVRMTRMLLRAGADAEREVSGIVPFVFAIRMGDTNVVQTLIDFGVKTNIVDAITGTNAALSLERNEDEMRVFLEKALGSMQ